MAAETVTCMECNGTAHRVSYPPPDEDFSAGDVIAYVCEDCGHRLDLVAGEPDDEPER